MKAENLAEAARLIGRLKWLKQQPNAIRIFFASSAGEVQVSYAFLHPKPPAHTGSHISCLPHQSGAIEALLLALVAEQIEQVRESLIDYGVTAESI